MDGVVRVPSREAIHTGRPALHDRYAGVRGPEIDPDNPSHGRLLTKNSSTRPDTASSGSAPGRTETFTLAGRSTRLPSQYPFSLSQRTWWCGTSARGSVSTAS